MKAPKIQKLRPQDLVVRHETQREAIQSWIRKLQGAYDPNAIGVIVVNNREDFSLSVIDGQHRIAALTALGHGAKPVACLVYEQLSERDEAELFLKFNDRRTVTPIDKFNVGVTAGRDAEVGVAKVLEDFGLCMRGAVHSNGYKSIEFPSSCLRVYRAEGRERSGEQALRAAFVTAIEAFGRDALEGKLIEGLGELFLSNSWVEKDALIKVLAKFPGGAPGVIGRGRTTVEVEGGPLGRACARVIATAYNKTHRKQPVKVG